MEKVFKRLNINVIVIKNDTYNLKLIKLNLTLYKKYQSYYYIGMNPFNDTEFLKCIKRSYIIKEMIKKDDFKTYDIVESNVKINNNIITITIRLNNDSNIYKYQYIPKQKQVMEINNKKIKITNKKNDILNLEKKFESMIID
jgi:hypothetical protein